MSDAEQVIYYMNYITSVYIGYVIIVTGLIGDTINILVFTQLKLFRNNPSAFYLIAAAVIEIFQLVFIVSTRVITATNGYDPTRTSLVWCKLRAFLSQWGGTMLPMVICLSAFDQYLSTSYHAQLRRISTLRLAQSSVIILCVLAAGYSIPREVFQEIHPRFGCGTYNASYNYFFSFVHLCIIIGLLPIAISSLFSFLAYRNVRRITRRQMPILRRRLDRQLTAMILVRVALFVTTTLPLASVRTYQINQPIDENNAYEVAVHQFIQMVVTTFFNINYSGSYYIFLVTSSRFRRQVKYLFSKKIWQKLMSIRGKKNEVAPANQLQIMEPHISAIEIE